MESKKLLKSYEAAVKKEEREWSEKFHSFSRQLAYADRWYSRGKYNAIMRELQRGEQIHKKYLDGLKVVAEMILEALSDKQ